MTDANRQTGRTFEMLRNCCERVNAGEHVVCFVGTAALVPYCRQMVLDLELLKPKRIAAHEVELDNGGRLTFWVDRGDDENEMRFRGRRALAAFDHSVWELRDLRK